MAYRKKALYDKNGEEAFLEATRMYLEAGLSANNKDASAYVLMSELEDDLIRKRFYILMAADLDENNREIKTRVSKVDARFTPELFSAIRRGDTRFMERVVKNKFHLDQIYQGKSTIEQAIDFDQSAILRMLLDDLDHTNAFLEPEADYPLLFHAAAVDAVGCIRLLDNYGVPMDYSDHSNGGVTALNICS